jgi:hypothetical protein
MAERVLNVYRQVLELRADVVRSDSHAAQLGSPK